MFRQLPVKNEHGGVGGVFWQLPVSMGMEVWAACFGSCL